MVAINPDRRTARTRDNWPVYHESTEDYWPDLWDVLEMHATITVDDFNTTCDNDLARTLSLPVPVVARYRRLIMECNANA